ncbi:response regulator [Pseudodesulfovibrio piezophilus]|uniref:Response regulator receiver modulated metal dependent phosphohydrolase n=1 Tax=Pseudodesulfovibrio piezophilus (strain DSM 21447 / JCM 15486 / C1TLV30) TaxID=1322246 RepID=M1WT38_PSEP2|nr:response regulator [Pseudodesulfovibrio piezophilus]CCH49257.1 Response regulator receiver modulated metal dependent phosphohydrolase [Pseudodesulfovibrio piezophilus C1TLV30]
MTTHTTNAPEGASPPHILVVDDSHSVRYALEKHLMEAGFSVTLAVNGEDALSKAVDGSFDLVITDIDMPKMDGYELCKRLKNEFKTSHIPIIVLSSRDSDDHVEEGFRVGADAYLAKGGNIEDNIVRIKDILNAKSFLTGSRILVVDDSASVRLFLESGLKEEGFIVETATNGREALERLPDFDPNLVITDLMMPEMDGAELCRAIKQSEVHNSVPVVIMSSLSDKPLMRRLMREGAATFLIKPFSVAQLSIVIEEIFSSNFRLLLEEKERLRMEHQLTLAAIASLVQALEARDSLTRGHSERVACIAMELGKEMGFSSSQVERLKLTGQLHDLGKIGVRDNVLLKKDSLDDGEFEHIKGHSSVVTNILRPIKSLHDILEVTQSHHERWDGNGYPEGLKGEEIPLKARIIAVADVFEAVTSERPYRDSMPSRVAYDIILEERGKQLCPTCVDAFLRWYEKTGGILKTHETSESDSTQS